MKFLPAILFILTALLTHAQVTFQRDYGGQVTPIGLSIQQTSDGGFIVAGFSDSLVSDDGYILKTDSIGNLLWNKSFGATHFDMFNTVRQTTDGGFIMAGMTQLWPVDTVYGFYHSKHYLVKVDSSGNLDWEKAYGTTGDETGLGVVQTPDGGFISVGSTENKPYIIKTDGNGNLQWIKSYGTTTGSLNIPSCCDGDVMDKAGNNDYVITGNYYSSLSPTQGHVCLLKINSTGNILWNKSYSTPKTDFVSTIKKTLDGGFIIASIQQDTSVNWDVQGGLIKTDSNGTIQWSKLFDAGIKTIRTEGVTQTSDSGFVMTGSSTDSTAQTADAFFIKVSNSGNLLWSESYGSSNTIEIGNNVVETSDGGLAMAGWERDTSFNPVNRVLLIKTDKDGNSGCRQNNFPVSSLDLTWQVDTLDITVTTPADTVLSGFTIVQNLSLADSILCSTVGISENNNNETHVVVYPNPFSVSATVKVNGYLPSQSALAEQGQSSVIGSQFILYDVFGREVRRLPFTDSHFLITRDNLPAGIYFYRITSDAQYHPSNKIISTGKIIIQ